MSEENINYVNFSLTESSLNLIPDSVIDEAPEFSTDIEFSNIQDKNCICQCYLRFLMGNKLPSIFNISSSSISILFFLLPFVILYNKIIFSFLEIILIGFFSFYTMNLLLEQMSKKKDQSYYKFVYNNVGKTTSYIYEVFNFIYKFSGLIILQHFSILFFKNIIIFKKIINDKDLYSKIILFGVCLVIQFIFSYEYFTIFLPLKYLNSITIIITQFILLFKLIIQSKSKYTIEWIKKEEFNNEIWIYIQILIIIFNNHNDIYLHFNRFYTKTFKRVNILINWSWIIIIVEIMTFMIILYLYTEAFNIELVFNNPIEYLISENKNDVFYYVFLILVIIFSINIQVLISESLYKIKEEIKIIFHQKIMMTSTNILITFFFLVLTNLISFIIYKIKLFIGICCGITCFTAYFFPAFSHLIVFEPNIIKKILNILIMIIFPILGMMMIFYSFYYL